MLNYFNNLIFNNSGDHTFSFIFSNIVLYVYIIFGIFFIFLLFDLNSFKSSSEFKIFSNLKNITPVIFTILLSFAGTPPLLGFSLKLFLFIILVKYSNLIFLFLFTIFNLFLIFFYLQNFRFFVSDDIFKNSLINFLILKNILIIEFIIIFNFSNLCGIPFLEEFYSFFNFSSLDYLN